MSLIYQLLLLMALLMLVLATPSSTDMDVQTCPLVCGHGTQSLDCSGCICNSNWAGRLF